jgi:predicted ArsR family transcriptional regulator
LRYDSRAYLQALRNVPRGLKSRDAILNHLKEEEWTLASDIAIVLDISYWTVLYHLRNLKNEGYVEKETDGKKWRLKEYPQAILTDYLHQKRKSSRKKKKGK